MNKTSNIEKYLSKEEIRVLTNFSMDSRLSNKTIDILKKSNQKEVFKIKTEIKKHKEKSFNY